jgi:uncharacterized spore protein YtfJ
MNIEEVIESVIAHAGRTIYGAPVSVEGRTIIPVARVVYGFGMGSGPARPAGAEQKAGGGGGGLRGKPAGFIEITAAGTRFVRIVDYRDVAVAAVVGLAAGYLIGAATSRP